MHFQQVAGLYKQACKAVSQAIKASPYKTLYVMEQLGFGENRSGFYARLSSANWEPEHLEKLGHLLDKPDGKAKD